MTEIPAREGESLWQRLRRRKVVQWGLAYTAGAWGFLQGLEYVSESFHWPDHYRQIALLALVAGLPIVLVLAWYHGDRGEQRVRGPEFAIITLLFLAGGGLFWWYGRTTEITQTVDTTASRSSPKAPSVDTDTRPSIAVLPFDNRSRLEDDVFFVDGIHDDILTQLSKISALKVISRTSVEQFRDTRLPIKEIAAQLGVRSILEGGVQRAGDRIRISVQLIDAGTDSHLWSETYDRELTAANIFGIQSELATAIAGALNAALSPTERTRAQSIPTKSLEAWEAYQLGMRRMATRNSADLASARQFLLKAIGLDPAFALAHVGLADTLSLQVDYSGLPPEPTLGRAEEAAAKALELDPNLAEAWASLGFIAQSRQQFDRSVSMFRRAIEWNPNYATAHHWLSQTLLLQGRREEALPAAQRATALDPLSPIINIWLGVVSQSVGRFDDARVALERAIRIDPMMAHAYTQMGYLQGMGFGQFGKAVPWHEKSVVLDPQSADNYVDLAQAYWVLGDFDEAARWLAKTRSLGDESAFANATAAYLYWDRGELELAQKHAKAAAALDPSYLFLVRDDDLRRNDYLAARARYADAYPRLFSNDEAPFDELEATAAIDLAAVLQHTGDEEQATALLDRADKYYLSGTIPRMGVAGYGYADARIYALRGERDKAIAALRAATSDGYRFGWRYYRDVDPALTSVRNDPEFKAIFAAIERDMARQRAALAARPKDAPL